MKKLIILLIGIFAFTSLFAQKDFPHDSTYYETYPNTIKGRFYLSQKYVHIHLPGKPGVKDLEYETNAHLNTGIGITVKGISINLFYAFNFLNKKDDPKGKTKGLDLQIHLYPRRWALDVLCVFPKGFHLEPKGFASATSNTYYYRPDLKLSMLGFSAYHVPNKRKFSYRAAAIQTEWQKKSAGSFLYGGGIYAAKIKGDSALVPKSVEGNYPQAGITDINFVSIGPGAGYAYTLVAGTHFFITASLVANLNINFTTEKGTSSIKNTSLSPAFVYKAGTGYNSANWSVGVSWLGNDLWFKGASSNENYSWPQGHYRFMISKKFHKKHNAG